MAEDCATRRQDNMRRILFFHQGKFSHTAEHLLAGLRQHFPQAEFRAVDIHRALKQRRITLAAGGIHALWTYGNDLLGRRRDLDDAFFGTRFLFEEVGRIARHAHRQWPADCSVQTQSMYDCSSPGVPHVLYTDHTYESCRHYPDYGRAIWNPARPDWLIDLERTVYRGAACTLTMSRNVARTLLDFYGLPESRVSCVRVGCNAAQARLSGIPCPLHRYEGGTVLFIGIDWQRKGGPQLVQAFRIVRRSLPHARLLIVGARPALREPNIRVIGPVPIDTIPEYLAAASVFCMPSRMEPLGVAWLEAMAAGLPAIGLNLGAAPDFILPGRTGLLIEPDDVAGLAQGMMDLLSNPRKCRAMGEAGRQLVCRDYTWDQACGSVAERMCRLTL